MKTLLWLDDYRDPYTRPDWLVFSPIEQPFKVYWAKSYKSFIQYIIEFGLPDAICFDHDLGTSETGYDCAKWLVEYCIDNDKALPLFNIQSANPVGAENIRMLLNNFNASSKV